MNNENEIQCVVKRRLQRYPGLADENFYQIATPIIHKRCNI